MAKDTNLDVKLRFLTQKFDAGITQATSRVQTFTKKVESMNKPLIKLGKLWTSAFVVRRAIRGVDRLLDSLLSVGERIYEGTERWQEFQDGLTAAQANLDEQFRPAADALMVAIEQIAMVLSQMDWSPVVDTLVSVINMAKELFVALGNIDLMWQRIKISVAKKLVFWDSGAQAELDADLAKVEAAFDKRMEAMFAKHSADKQVVKANRLAKEAEKQAAKAPAAKRQRPVKEERDPEYDMRTTGGAEAGSERAFQIAARAMFGDPTANTDKKQLKTLEKIESGIDKLVKAKPQQLAVANL